MTDEREQALRRAVAVVQEALANIYGQLYAVVANNGKQLLERQQAAERVLREIGIVSPMMAHFQGTVQEVQEVLAMLAADTARELESQELAVRSSDAVVPPAQARPS